MDTKNTNKDWKNELALFLDIHCTNDFSDIFDDKEYMIQIGNYMEVKPGNIP